MVRVHGVADACVSEFWPVNYYVLLITWIKIMEWGQFYLILTRWIAKLLLQSTYCTYLSLVFHYVNMEGTFSCSCVDCWHEDGHEPLGKIGCASLPFCVCSFNWSAFEVKWPQATSSCWVGPKAQAFFLCVFVASIEAHLKWNDPKQQVGLDMALMMGLACVHMMWLTL